MSFCAERARGHAVALVKVEEHYLQDQNVCLYIYFSLSFKKYKQEHVSLPWKSTNVPALPFTSQGFCQQLFLGLTLPVRTLSDIS